MISYFEALKILQEVALQLSSVDQEIPITESIGTVLSRDVFGREDVPYFQNSAMDGFAICAAATAGASAETPLRFPIDFYLAAGDAPPTEPIKNTTVAVEIMTGAPMPAGCLDAVVRVEDTQIEEHDGMREVLIRKSVRSGENVRAQGSDFRANELVGKAGTVVDPEYLMAFACLGISSIWVRKRLKVAVLSTGKELRAVGLARSNPAQIWNSSGPYLIATLKDLGCEVIDFGIIEDEPDLFISAVREGLQRGVDIFLSTGAVSMGKHDFVVEALQKLGAKLHFHKTSIRPGKPICFAEFAKEGAVFFGLPGNPVSTAVGMRFFAEPFLRTRLGIPTENGIEANLKQEIKKPEGLRCFYKGRVEINAEGAVVEVLQGQGSYILNSLIQANCWVQLMERESQLPAGAEVRVFSLGNSFRKGVSS